MFCSQAAIILLISSALQYKTNFDSADEQTGWTFSSTQPPITWAMDGTPANILGGSYLSAPSSLNYNNATNYQSGILPNSGTALSPIIDISNMGSPRLVFWCNFFTDSPSGDTDKRIVRIKSNDNLTVLKEANLTFNDGCYGFGLWHPHIIHLRNEWLEVRIEFSFDTVTMFRNDYAGWFVDNLTVDETSSFQQTIYYQQNFDSIIDWQFTFNQMGNMFSVGPGAGSVKSLSGFNTLRYNNGVNYNTGGRNFGSALSPPITIGAYRPSYLLFWCNYNTDTSNSSSDKRFVSIHSSITGSLLATYQVTGSGESGGIYECPEMDVWHSHIIPLKPEWNQIELEFSFDTINEKDNDRTGWHIDNITILGNAQILETRRGGGVCSGSISFRNPPRDVTGWLLLSIIVILVIIAINWRERLHNLKGFFSSKS